MRATNILSIRDKFAKNEVVINGWVNIPHRSAAEMMGYQGYDTLTVDSRFCMGNFENILHIVQSISKTPAIPFVRVTESDALMITHLISSGAKGMISPGLVTAEQARRFVAACRSSLHQISPLNFQCHSAGGEENCALSPHDNVLTLALIDSCEGIANLEDILHVDGLDGVYVNPFHLSSILTKTADPESCHPAMLTAIEMILSCCNRVRKIAGIDCSTGAAAAERNMMGFKLVTLSDQLSLLRQASLQAVSLMNGKNNAFYASV